MEVMAKTSRLPRSISALSCFMVSLYPSHGGGDFVVVGILYTTVEDNLAVMKDKDAVAVMQDFVKFRRRKENGGIGWEVAA